MLYLPYPISSSPHSLGGNYHCNHFMDQETKALSRLSSLRRALS